MCHHLDATGKPACHKDQHARMGSCGRSKKSPVSAAAAICFHTLSWLLHHACNLLLVCNILISLSCGRRTLHGQTAVPTAEMVLTASPEPEWSSTTEMMRLRGASRMPSAKRRLLPSAVTASGGAGVPLPISCFHIRWSLPLSAGSDWCPTPSSGHHYFMQCLNGARPPHSEHSAVWSAHRLSTSLLHGIFQSACPCRGSSAVFRECAEARYVCWGRACAGQDTKQSFSYM